MVGLIDPNLNSDSKDREQLQNVLRKKAGRLFASGLKISHRDRVGATPPQLRLANAQEIYRVTLFDFGDRDI
jgi:hypothetical protein